MLFKKKDKQVDKRNREYICFVCKNTYGGYYYEDSPNHYPNCPFCGSYNVAPHYSHKEHEKFIKTMDNGMILICVVYGSIFIVIIILAYFLINWLF